MHSILEVLHLTLLTIAKAVFDGAFLVILGLIFFMIKKSQNINIYGYKIPYQNSAQFIESILQGIVIGWIGSTVMTFIGLPIRITTSILFLLPIAIVLAFIHPRFLCFSYSVSILSFLGLLFQGQILFGIKMPFLDIDISGLMVLVGILHLMEALLVYQVGSKYAIPIITKRNGRIMFGHILQRFWPIPFAILAINMGQISGEMIHMPKWWPLAQPNVIMDSPIYFYALLPIIGALGYKTISFAYEPVKKAKISAKRLFFYSVILLVLAVLSTHYMLFQVLGIVFMSLAHEGIILYDQYVETQKKPIYGLPDKGVRVLTVYPEGPASKIGIEVGDIIQKVNGVEVEDVKDFKVLLQDTFRCLYLEVKKINGLNHIFKFVNYRGEDDSLGFQVLPEKPTILIKYDSLNEFSILHIILKKLNKKI